MARAREFDEEAVLSAAMALFRQQGYRRTSISDLARVTGVQRGSLYNAYQDKESVFLKVYQHYTEQFLADCQAALAEGPLRIRLTLLSQVWIRSMRQGTPAQGCLTTRTIMEAADELDSTRSVMAQFLSQLENLIAEALEAGRAQGEFSGDARATARLLVSVSRGMAVLERVYDDEERLQQIATETIGAVTGAAGRS